MGIVSLKNEQNLFWLGRYTERVFTTTEFYMKVCDEMLDKNPEYYKVFLQQLGLPDIYLDGKDFKKRYVYDNGQNPNSIWSNLSHAYDNAIILRDSIGSECLSYIQLALNGIEDCGEKDVYYLECQYTIDILRAFWGSADDEMGKEERAILKFGKRIERLELNLRFNTGELPIKRAYERMKYRLEDIKNACSNKTLEEMESIINEVTFDDNARHKMIDLVNSIYPGAKCDK